MQVTPTTMNRNESCEYRPLVVPQPRIVEAGNTASIRNNQSPTRPRFRPEVPRDVKRFQNEFQLVYAAAWGGTQLDWGSSCPGELSDDGPQFGGAGEHPKVEPTLCIR